MTGRLRLESVVRPCDGCTECCTRLGVTELAKPAGERCAHVGVTGGCTIYRDRPRSCAAYACLWALGRGTEADRPDLSGVLASHAQAAGEPVVFVHGLRPDVTGVADMAARLAPGAVTVRIPFDRRALEVEGPAGPRLDAVRAHVAAHGVNGSVEGV